MSLRQQVYAGECRMSVTRGHCHDLRLHLISHRRVVVVRFKLYTALLAAPPTRCAYSASAKATSLPDDTDNRQSCTRLVQTNPNRDICAVSRFHRAFAVPSTMPLRAATAHMLALSSAPPSVPDDPSCPGSARALKGRHLTSLCCWLVEDLW